MPRIAKFELPDGRKGKLEIPDNATQQDIEAAIQQATGFTGEPAEATPQEPGFLDKLQQFGRLVEQTSPLGASKKVMDLVQQGADFAGEKIAELPETFPNLNPTATGIAGGFVANAPDIALGLAGGGAGVKGSRIASEALKRSFTSKGIGAQIGAAEKAAGVSKRLTTTDALKSALQVKGKGGFTDVANKVDDLLASGTELPAQFLSDFRVALKKALNTPAFSKGEPQALLLNIKDKADDAFNALVPGRAKLSKKFSTAKSREKLLKSLGGVAKKGAGIAALGAVGGGAGLGVFNLFK